jgi:hypothetical protein
MTKRLYHYIFYILSISVIYVAYFSIKKSIYHATYALCDTPFMTYFNSYVIHGVSQGVRFGLYIDGINCRV